MNARYKNLLWQSHPGRFQSESTGATPLVTKLWLGHAYPRSSASSSDVGLPPSKSGLDSVGKWKDGLRERAVWHAGEAELRG